MDTPMDTLLQNITPFWFWLALCCLFMAVEVLVVSTGFFLCLGTSAGVVALLAFLFPSLSWLWAGFVFSVLAVASGLFWWYILHKKLGRTRERENTLNMKMRQLIGHRAVLAEPIRAGRGRLRVNDSDWPAQAEADYPAGTLVEVTDVQGIVLRIRAVPAAQGGIDK